MQIQKQNELEQARRKRTHSRLVVIVGEALLQHASSTPAFDATLRNVLRQITDERTRKFLIDVGWAEEM